MDTSSIDYAEGRVFTFEDESAIRPGFLETIEYSGPRQHAANKLIRPLSKYSGEKHRKVMLLNQR